MGWAPFLSQPSTEVSGRQEPGTNGVCFSAWLLGYAQDQAQMPRRKSAVHAAKLGSTWEKLLCPGCVSLVKDEPVTACHKILSSVKNEIASTFKSLMDRIQGLLTSLPRAPNMPVRKGMATTGKRTLGHITLHMCTQG